MFTGEMQRSILLDVDVAERIRQGAEEIANRTIRGKNTTHVEDIRHNSVTAWRRVVDSDCTSDSVSQVRVKSLPDPVNTINHGVVKPKGGIIGRGEDISCLATKTSMTSSVKTQESITKAALELSLEGIDVVAGGADGDVDEVLQGEELGHDDGGEVAAQAAGVVAQVAGWAGVEAAHGGADWAEMQFHADGELVEWARRDGGERKYSLKGPDLTQPPPRPEGTKRLPCDARVPLCSMNAPSPLMLVSLPSNNGLV